MAIVDLGDDPATQVDHPTTGTSVGIGQQRGHSPTTSIDTAVFDFAAQYDDTGSTISSISHISGRIDGKTALRQQRLSLCWLHDKTLFIFNLSLFTI